MINVRADFQERVEEVEEFLGLVAAIEHSAQNGVPLVRAGASDEVTRVTPRQQKLLYAGVYLHLYNLVEATVCRCIAAIEEAASANSVWRAGDLSDEMRSEWVRTMAQTHKMLNDNHRLEAALKLCNHLIEMLPVEVTISQGAGGNWDDEQIFDFTKRLGLALKLTPKTQKDVKSSYRDNKGALATIKELRNKLAHGAMSFTECGEGHTAAQLTTLKDATVQYLSEVVGGFEAFIQRCEYLHPTKRPAQPANAG